MSAQACRTCRHWQGDAKMSRHGFGACGLGERWVFWPAGHQCGRWTRMTSEQETKRARFFGGGR